MSSPFKLLEKQISPSSLLCRGCLAESGEMKNMYEWCLTDDFYKFSDVQLSERDNLSVLLCSKCEIMLQNCQSFRQQCQNSNEILKNMLKSETKPQLFNTISNSNNIDYILTAEKLTYMVTLPYKQIESPLPCPFKCKKTYNTKPILMEHLINRHNVNNSNFSIEIQYYCIFNNCKYHMDSLSYFGDRDQLDKHYEEHGINEYNCMESMTKYNKKSHRNDVCKCVDLDRNKQISKTEKEEPKTVTQNSIKSTLLENELILKIFAPDTESKLYLPCPYNCHQSYIKKKDLFSHLRKQHNINEDFQIKLQYYCSIHNCTYNIDSDRDIYFSERKFLNQHYVKKHKSKDYVCGDCSRDFATENDFNRHKKYCNMPFICELCSNEYKTHERWLVHIMRKHPQLHKKYKDSKKGNKRTSVTSTDSKKQKIEIDKTNDFICDSPKRSFATQTNPYINIRNDVTLPSWISTVSTKKDEISTQTGFEDILSLKSQNSEDDSLFCSETVSLSDIQTQTPFEFGLSRSNKEIKNTDVVIKETQTCVCMYESPKANFRLFDSYSSSPSINLTSTETQTADIGCPFTLNSAETQTCFEESL